MNKIKNTFKITKYFTFDSEKMIIFTLLPTIEFCKDNRLSLCVYDINLYWLFFEITFSYTKFKI